MHNLKHSARGASTLEYALLLALLAVMVIAVLASLGMIISSNVGSVSSAIGTPNGLSPLQSLLADISDWQARMLAYHQKYGSWPRTWSPYNFTDLGLNPADWSQPIDGLMISPHGDEIGLTPAPNYQVYVKDLNGNTLKLYSGWAIWCPVGDSNCYYHTVAPGNEININTLYVTGP
jgi:Flp pilus assembly pilin Flp